MRLGFGLPQTGHAAGPDGVSKVARRAEQFVAEDINSTRKLGAAELVLDVQFLPDVKTTEDMFKRMEDLKRVAT